MLIYNADLSKIEELVNDVSERVFHLRGLLSVYANILARDTTRNRSQGEVFNQNIVNQVMVLCRSATPIRVDSRVNFPPQLLEAEAEYFSGALLYIRDYSEDPNRIQVGFRRISRWQLQGGVKRAESDLYSATLAQEACVQVTTDIKNLLVISTIAHQVTYLVGKFSLSKASAKAVGKVLGTSIQNRRDIALKAHSKIVEARVFSLEKELIVVRKRVPPDQREIEAKLALYEAGCLLAEEEKNAMRLNPDHALEYLRLTPAEEEKHRVYQVQNAVDPEAVIFTLQQIVGLESILLPESQVQDQLLRYRYEMLQCLDGIVNQTYLKKFDLMPLGGYTRIFVQMGKDAVAHLAPKINVNGVPRIQPSADRDLAAILPLVFREKQLNNLLSAGKQFGSSISTDGIQLQFRVVDAQQVANKKRKYENIAAWRRGDAPQRVAPIEPTIEEQAEQEAARVAAQVAARLAAVEERRRLLAEKFSIPEGAELIACDPGIFNVGAFCRATRTDDGKYIPGETFVISTGSYYHDIGQTSRRNDFNARKQREDQRNASFAVASKAVAVALTKTADPVQLLEALRTRGQHFRTLYKFYGQMQNARIRWANYQGSRSWMDKLLPRLLPTPNHILLVGDATFANSVKGLPAGVVSKVMKHFERTGAKIRYVDEFRTSLLDSYNQVVTSHPPRKFVTRMNRHGRVVKYFTRINGLAQSSVSGAPRLLNRDINASRNILINFVAKCTTGKVLREFDRQTPKRDLVRPRACYAYYSERRNGRKGFNRVIRLPPPPPPLPLPQPMDVQQQEQ